MSSPNARKILAVVKRIPSGSVATYGQIARLAGIPRNARQVGTVLRSLPEEGSTPWHRVVNSHGAISSRGGSAFEQIQQALLEAEGIEFNDRDRVNLREFQWDR